MLSKIHPMAAGTLTHFFHLLLLGNSAAESSVYGCGEIPRYTSTGSFLFGTDLVEWK